MPRMPDDGEAIQVEVTGGTQDWTVTGLAKCRDYTSSDQVQHKGCGEPIFWCRTPGDRPAPADTYPNNEGVYQAHHMSCIERRREDDARRAGKLPLPDPKPSWRDRAAGDS